jgi:hypothetical protein
MLHCGRAHPALESALLEMADRAHSTRGSSLECLSHEVLEKPAFGRLLLPLLT